MPVAFQAKRIGVYTNSRAKETRVLRAFHEKAFVNPPRRRLAPQWRSRLTVFGSKLVLVNRHLHSAVAASLSRQWYA